MNEIRAALQADLPQLLSLIKAFYKEERLSFDSAVASRAVTALTANPALGEMIVVQVDDELVGYLALTFGHSIEYGGRDAFVDELYVRDEHRRAGHAARLLEHAMSVCRANGVRALHLEVENANAKARALYNRYEFVDHDRILMTRLISHRDRRDAYLPVQRNTLPQHPFTLRRESPAKLGRKHAP
ncbi:MAG: GNAT family N-acetyltransferase [Candidatus Hydrogenedentales bacterium]